MISVLFDTRNQTMKNLHPLIIILIGLYIVSLGFNILMYQENKKLIEQLKEKPRVIIFAVPEKKDFT